MTGRIALALCVAAVAFGLAHAVRRRVAARSRTPRRGADDSAGPPVTLGRDLRR